MYIRHCTFITDVDHTQQLSNLSLLEPDKSEPLHYTVYALIKETTGAETKFPYAQLTELRKHTKLTKQLLNSY